MTAPIDLALLDALHRSIPIDGLSHVESAGGVLVEGAGERGHLLAWAGHGDRKVLDSRGDRRPHERKHDDPDEECRANGDADCAAPARVRRSGEWSGHFNAPR